ncbi:MAG: outer membrane beta-barrel protein [Hyphomonadaceae bacterium]
MKLKTSLAAIAAISAACAMPAFAQDAGTSAEGGQTEKKSDDAGFYAGAGISVFFIDKDLAASNLPISFVDQPSPAAFMGRIGYAFNKHFAVEVEAGIGGASSDFGSGDNTWGNIGIGHAAGVHAVVTAPIGGGYYLLGKAGYQTFTIEREYFNYDVADITADGAAFSVGAGSRSGSMDYRLEYAIQSADGGNNGVLGLSILKHF